MNKIPVINIYPMQQEPYNTRRVHLHELGIKNGLETNPLPGLITINTPLEHVTQALNSFSSNLIVSIVEKKLESLSEYQLAKSHMPNLSDVKNIAKYRKNHPKYCSDSVSKELDIYGKLLSKGQVLFHGGVYPRSAETGVCLHSFTTDRPLSTTLCAQVASVHSLYHQPKEIWIIHIAEHARTKAFVYKNNSGQTHGHETEILLSPNAHVRYISEHKINNHTIYEVELT